MTPLPWMAPISGDEPRETWRWTGGEGQGPPSAEVAADDREQIGLVQPPGSGFRVTVYELPELATAVARRDHARLRSRLLVLLATVLPFAGLATWMTVRSELTGWAALASTLFVLAPLGLAGAPLAAQYRRALTRWDQHARLEAQALRYDRWIGHRLPSRRRFVGMLAPVLLVSAWAAWSGADLHRVAWDPQALGHEPWRWLTGPVVHASWGHLIVNLLMAFILGRTAEALLGRPVAAIALVMGMVAGGLASLLLGTGAPSVGMSSGGMALLGLLLAWWWRWRPDTPEALTWLVAPILVLTAMFGAVGHAFVNNAAHLGGIVAGFGLGACLGRPWPSSERRPCGWAAVDCAALAVIWAACLACPAVEWARC